MLVAILIGLLVVGCGNNEQTSNTNDGNSAPEKYAKKLTAEEEALRDSVVGTYEIKKHGYTFKYVLLKSGAFEGYRIDGKAVEQTFDSEWEIVDGEIHVWAVSIRQIVYEVNEDGSITYVADIWKDGQDKKRIDLPKDEQATYKKTK